MLLEIGLHNLTVDEREVKDYSTPEVEERCR